MKLLPDNISSQHKKLIYALSCLVLVWIVLIVIYSGSIFSLIPSEQKIAQAKLELKKQRSLNEVALKASKHVDSVNQQYMDMIKDAWKESTNGVAETQFRTLINNCAQKCEVQLNSIGAVKVTRINNEFYVAEVDISARLTYAKLILFLSKIEELSPKPYWKRIYIRPDFMPQNRNNQKSTVNLAAAAVENETRVSFSGNLRVLGFDGKVSVLPSKGKKGATK
jgi:hypothetical protein